MLKFVAIGSRVKVISGQRIFDVQKTGKLLDDVLPVKKFRVSYHEFRWISSQG